MKIQFQDVLKNLMLGHNLNKVAQACKIPQSTLHGWLNGSNPSLKNIDQLIALAKYFKTDLEFLLTGKSQIKNEVSLTRLKLDLEGKEYFINVSKQSDASF